MMDTDFKSQDVSVLIINKSAAIRVEDLSCVALSCEYCGPLERNSMSFAKLQLIEPILKAIKLCGYTTPTPIQEQAIPKALAGQDLIATAQTGTGKTAAFVLPALQRLSVPSQSEGRSKGPRVLVLTPTRE